MSSLETIKRSLRNYIPTSVNLDDFIKSEMALALLEKCKPEGDPTKAYLLLHVGLSIILDTIIKKFDRRKPFEGTHRTVVCST